MVGSLGSLLVSSLILLIRVPPLLLPLTLITPCEDKEMEGHSSVLTWRIPWTEEPGMLQSMGLQRVNLHHQIQSS